MNEQAIEPEVVTLDPEYQDHSQDRRDAPRAVAVAPYVPEKAELVQQRAQANVDEGLMTPRQYRALADRLLFDNSAWSKYYNRCQMIASTGMYGYKDAATVAAAGLKGMSLGMSFFEAIDRIKVIKGTPVIRGPAAMNHIHERCAGAKLRCILSTDKEAVWEMSRPDWETKTYRYTWEQAERAGIVQRNSVYKSFPERCLKWQALSEGVQEMFGDVLGGLYLQEEIAADKAISDQVEAAVIAQLEQHEEKTRSTEPKSDYEPERAKDTGYEAPSGTSSSTGDPDVAQEPEAPAQPTAEHPRMTRMKELLAAVARKRGATDDTFDSVRKSVRDETITICGIKLSAKTHTPTLPQIEKMIKHLESQ